MWEVDGRFDPHRAVGGGVLHHLVYEARERVGFRQHVARGDVHPRERGEVAEAPDRRYVDTQLVGEVTQRARPHRAFEVEVEVGLRESPEIAHRRDPRIVVRCRHHGNAAFIVRGPHRNAGASIVRANSR
jgi:hypothetical protein